MQKILQINILYPVPFPAHPNPRTPNPQSIWGTCSVHTALSSPVSFRQSGWSVVCYLLVYFLSGEKKKREKKKGRG